MENAILKIDTTDDFGDFQTKTISQKAVNYGLLLCFISFFIAFIVCMYFIDYLSIAEYLAICLGTPIVIFLTEYVFCLATEVCSHTPTVKKKLELNESAYEKDLAELNGLIGLESVKEEIRILTNFVKINKQKEALGLPTTDISCHCVFTGNPGTGKTTVARIVAKLYKDLGIIGKGHLVEVDRSKLIGEYMGQTAVKTNKVIDSALDGVLFIDEAYTLSSHKYDDYGEEAIATLLKRMEDDRDRLIVIVAGYTNEMMQFIDSNPGLKSRFSHYIDFKDYKKEDLYKIFMYFVQKGKYVVSDDAKLKLKQILVNAISSNDKNFGNGRFVRNLFEKTLLKQANRLVHIDSTTLSKDALMTIEMEDIR